MVHSPAARAAAVVVAWGAALIALRYLPRALANVAEKIHEDDLAQYRLLEAAVLASDDGILIADATGARGATLRIAVANPAFERMTGYSAYEAVGQSPSILFGDDTEAESRALATIRAAMRSDEPAQFEVPGRRKDGSRLWAEWKVVPVRGKDGVCTHRVAVLRETTERRRAEDALREQTAFLRTLIAHIPCGVFWKDRESVYLGCNDQMVRDYGLQRSEQLLGRTDFDLPGQTAAEAEFYRACDRRVIVSGSPLLHHEHTQPRPDGTQLTLLTSKVPLRNAAGEVVGVLGVYQDITARQLLERKLRDAAKMEIVGKLAGSIAHDFNNLLTVVGGNADLLGLPDLDPAERENLLADITQASARGAGLIRQLLLFSKNKPARVEVVDVNDVVTGLGRLIDRWLGERVAVRLRLHASPVRVRGDRSQLEQVVMNLAVNARDAMPAGGHLTITTEADFDPRTRAPLVRLVVADTGTGMTDEVRARMFEPFFTTKEAVKGTGIGLATVHGIVEQAGGRIELESAVGVGTTFRVTLPAYSGQPASSPRLGDTPAPGGAGRAVLLVEDEPTVRKLARIALEGHGYAVTEAGDGEEALRELSPDAPLDLLVTDLSMPRMNGEELAARLRAAQPWVGVVFTSGGPADAGRLEKVLGAVFLPKPFTAAELLRAARKGLKTFPAGVGATTA
jgi:two-component system cell cycle sensor histidine kinase/response regulator CckA